MVETEMLTDAVASESRKKLVLNFKLHTVYD